ncbi:5'-AMP-activated protein kinase subunit beta, putative [Phytophthora infestans T30-4]|uniref:5'-AMP-activated protein kinase subunit beta, putative n=1 Tax=Phytophthora infestans (strain T30-4) TaxID=403677 RepID=D0NQL8_PHYIT|nr:5'-AMP-activated protein kinase subunit beta, putative [Phytophthora infestans T30-4]EEY62966.1 5'-AMP-activated protein kinase subunit beta, putative [Phytophthora infestans T30-4]|eukprot:XP_002898489.1 5'-AMP-activated protein kinase subunit beta, putative [Phytophthora infestans T30-4]
MGSATSKAGDANPKNLGADPNDPNAFPLHHHPYYNQAQQQQGRNFDGSSEGKHSQQPYYAGQSNATEAMEVDPPTETSSEGDNAQTVDVTVPPGEDVVPMVFKWEHGGRNVFITGTFNGWDKQCPMHRSGNDFTYIANLTRGKHMYKFVVDDDWRFAPDQLTMADVEGNVNNYVDVSDFAPLSDFDGKNRQDDDEDPENPYARYIPEIDEYTKEPPPLPPHLRHIILNKAPPTVDGRLLPVPQHVALNHLYCTAIKDGMMVLGITNRYKQKFVTTVYYSLMPGAN